MGLRIATRKSKLALWQAHWVQAELGELGHDSELVLIDTQGDLTQTNNQPFATLQGQGFFTKAVQDALLAGRADVAVHSHKDLPSLSPGSLQIAAVTKRANPHDVLLVREAVGEAGLDAVNLDAVNLDALKIGAVVGTSAVRRQKQLLALRPDLSVRELRGNVPTRVQKLRSGDYDAIILAAAGLERLELDLTDLKIFTLSSDIMMPAPAQGALALETHREAYDAASILTDLHHIKTYKEIAAERGLMAMLQGGCQLALGAYAKYENGLIKLQAWYEGKQVAVEHPSSESAAMLAFDALGRPTLTS